MGSSSMKSQGKSSPSDHDALVAFVEKAKPLSPSFYRRDAITVAKDLLQKLLAVRHGRLWLVAEIVETEAYLGADDPASHAFRGISPRNEAMFKDGGHCYVYLSYGVNYCMNVVTGREHHGQAVLLRAAVPKVGLASMRKRRQTDRDAQLMNGPGKLTQALGIDLRYDGTTFDRQDFKLVDSGLSVPTDYLGISPRIGISKAKDEPLRFYLRGSTWLSRKG